MSTPTTDSDHLPVISLSTDDAGEILTLQRAAYLSEAQLHNDLTIPPLTETLAEVRTQLAREDVRRWGIRSHRRLVAAVRVTIRGHDAELGRFTVVPDRQGEGLGTRLLRHVERHLPPAVTTISLFTGELSAANLRLYRRHGYDETHRSPAGHYELVHLTKVLPR